MEEEKVKVCSVCGITSNEKRIKFSPKANQYLCQKHYKQIYTYGRIIDPSPRTTHDKNEYVLYDDHAEIIMRDRKQQEVARAIIDLDDVDRCKLYKWSCPPARSADGRRILQYPRAKNPHINISLHRYILGYDGDMEVDHINRNTLDARKSNLRIVPRIINAANNGGKYVYSDKRGKWKADIRHYGKRFISPWFSNEQDALDYRDEILKYIDDHQEELLRDYNRERGIV